MKNFFSVFAVLALSFLCVFPSACDMTYIEEEEKSILGDGSETENVSYLTIASLPVNVQKTHFSEVFLYGADGKIAKCADYSKIVISKNASQATARIPLAVNDNSSSPFLDTGLFLLSFTAKIDYLTQVSKKESDYFSVYCTAGNVYIDLADHYGYFAGSFTDYTAVAAPVIKEGTSFEMNGSYFNIEADTPVQLPFSGRTSLYYIYALQKLTGLEFECSETVPEFDPLRNGYYSGDRRALFKFIFINDDEAQYFAKSFVEEPWVKGNNTNNPAANFPRYTFNHPINDILSNLGLGLFDTYHALGGSANPPPQKVTLPRGGYVFILAGAGGGSTTAQVFTNTSGNIYGGFGGEGGFVAEFVIVPENTEFTIFAGQGGNNANPHTSGGAGGGSGTFVYSSKGYFLCAGGGGGGGGDSIMYSTGGAGGAGGVIGSGAGGGGGSGYYSEGDPDDYYDDVTTNGDNGNNGGGYLAGSGGDGGVGGGINQSGKPGENGTSFISGFPAKLGGGGAGALDIYQNPTSGAGGNVPYFDNVSWTDTNNAYGRGGNASGQTYATPGESGGNNRNDVRGGGGSAGISSYQTTNGSFGSVLVYKVF